jgi:hypothetical protein
LHALQKPVARLEQQAFVLFALSQELRNIPQMGDIHSVGPELLFS